MVTTGVRSAAHSFALLSSAEQGWEEMAGFIADGIERQEQVVVAGLDADQRAHLMRRLSEEDGVDSGPAVADGQLVVMDDATSQYFLGLSTVDFSAQVRARVDQALRDGYRGVRLTGIYQRGGVGPHEFALDELVRTLRLKVFCPYFRTLLSPPEMEQLGAWHGSEVIDSAVFDDGSLRITHPRCGWLRLAGRWDSHNHAAALTVVSAQTAAGARDLDLASLRYIDPVGVHFLLTGVGGSLRLRRPNPLVQRLAGFLAEQRRPPV